MVLDDGILRGVVKQCKCRGNSRTRGTAAGKEGSLGTFGDRPDRIELTGAGSVLAVVAGLRQRERGEALAVIGPARERPEIDGRRCPSAPVTTGSPDRPEL
jgi:hypothetical protein